MTNYAACVAGNGKVNYLANNFFARFCGVFYSQLIVKVHAAVIEKYEAPRLVGLSRETLRKSACANERLRKASLRRL